MYSELHVHVFGVTISCIRGYMYMYSSSMMRSSLDFILPREAVPTLSAPLGAPTLSVPTLSVPTLSIPPSFLVPLSLTSLESSLGLNILSEPFLGYLTLGLGERVRVRREGLAYASSLWALIRIQRVHLFICASIRS